MLLFNYCLGTSFYYETAKLIQFTFTKNYEMKKVFKILSTFVSLCASLKRGGCAVGICFIS